MKVLTMLSMLSVALLAASAASRGETRAPPQRSSEPVLYEVAYRPRRGMSSAGFSINDRGWVAGRSNLPGNQIRHATLWRDGVLTDLGTLGTDEFRNSVVRWLVKNVNGLVAGISQTDEAGPEQRGLELLGVLPPRPRQLATSVSFKWQNGEMTLPTLGAATLPASPPVPTTGRIVGWAETTVEDPENCVPPQRFRFLPVVYGPRDDQIRALPLLQDDTSGAATAINDRGQIVGISGIRDQAVGRFTARHAAPWDNGEVIDIGNLGGVAWHTPNAINLHGDVVGFSNFSAADGGEYHPHAFLWTKDDGIRDLGTLPAPFDDNSDAWGINQWGRRLAGPAMSMAPRLPVARRRYDRPELPG